MHIAKTGLQNRRNFADAAVDHGMGIFPIGPNAAGTSSFLDSLRFLEGVARHGRNKAVIGMRGGVTSIRHVNARSHQEIAISMALDTGWRHSLSFGANRRPSPSLSTKRPGLKGGSSSIVPTGAVHATRSALERICASKDFRETRGFFGNDRMPAYALRIGIVNPPQGKITISNRQRHIFFPGLRTNQNPFPRGRSTTIPSAGIPQAP
jgi:hypothetical protein